ncbi:MAG TPA: TonB-dependent receptor [Ohtaekwangia sp.]|nr:TonB-dependent receptor [Ohtaekwangia sp.]
MTASTLKVLRYFSLCLVLLPLAASGQQQQRVTVNLTDAPFETFVESIEAQTAFRFYFNPQWTDTLKITVNASQELLPQVLDRALQTTALLYTISERNIYITYERPLMAELPVNFFNDEKVASGRNDNYDYTEFERRAKQVKQAEERLYIIGVRTTSLEGNATVSGSITDLESGEPVIGVSVFIQKPLIGVVTNQFGHYALTIPRGRHELLIKSLGMKETRRQIMLYNDGKLNIEMEEDITPLKEVVVESDRDVNITGMQMGVEKLDIKTMKQMPLALGETDIMKVMLTLPGVQTVGEGTVGLNVRGGATNQNLILYNDAVVYNPSHLFGFFSTFNPDILKNVELYKSGVTAEYGGRLSSVLDVHTREGNSKKLEGSGGISPITGRISLEGPIVKDRTSFILGARSTYSNWILRRLKDPQLKRSEASFYDLNLGISHKIDENNNLYFSGYMSRDRFKLGNDTAYQYSDRNASLKWKRVFNSKLYGVLTGSVSQYQYAVSSTRNPLEAFKLDFDLNQLNIKADINYFPNAQHTIIAGASMTRYGLSPGNFQPIGSASEITPDKLQSERGIENAVYVGDQYELTAKLSIYAGVRFSHFQNLGARDVFTYPAGAPREEGSIQDTVHYSSGKPLATYYGAEPRVSVRYSVSKNSSIKFSYNRMRQYIQMLSNTTAISPTDIWKLSDRYIQPQLGDQISIGYYANFRGGQLETSVESYYKTTKNATDFKDGAELLMNHHLETDVLTGKGKAYGAEFLIKKPKGKLNGWISYTWSRSFIQASSVHLSETVNEGVYYPTSYDKPHAFNFIGNYKFSRRFNFSLNMTYSTGRPLTIPLAKYEINGTTRLYYSDRNAFRIPHYFRTDISINVEGNHRVKKLAHSSWTFALYNLTGRENAYSVYFESEGTEIKGYKLSIFARPIPTITYNFKF